MTRLRHGGIQVGYTPDIIIVVSSSYLCMINRGSGYSACQ